MERDYKKEYKDFHGKPTQIAKRATRNAARASKGLPKGDGKEVHHKTPLSKGGGNSRGNLSVISRHANRAKGGK